MGFFFLYIISFAIIACLLGMLGLDLITAISGAASAIGNVGPGREILLDQLALIKQSLIWESFFCVLE